MLPHHWDWQAIQAIAESLAALLAVAAIFFTLSTFSRDLKNSHYTELDRMYLDILRIAVDRPFVRNPKEINDPEMKSVYDVYAFIVWNFLEAIYDRCRKDRTNRTTWFPIIETEGALHYDWFIDQQNAKNFKPEFHNWARNYLEKKNSLNA